MHVQSVGGQGVPGQALSPGKHRNTRGQMSHQPYYALSTYFRQRFGRRVQKIPLDAGFSCPNRDGTISRQGCLFCNADGSGTGLLRKGLNLAAQWNHWRGVYNRRSADASFIAYLQSYSNTHGPLSKLRRTLEQLAPLPGLIGLAVGTRPDCLDREKLALLASLPRDPFVEIWLELGLQSADNHVLQRINRGHDLETFVRACHEVAAHGLFVCAHLIAGLPGEDKSGFLRSVRTLNQLPVHGVKFHSLYVCAGSPLAELWHKGEYAPLALECYLDWIADGIALLRPDMVVQRLTGDPAPHELLAPPWVAVKSSVRAGILDALRCRDLWQGKILAPKASMPAWFDGDSPPAFAAQDRNHDNRPIRVTTGAAHAF